MGFFDKVKESLKFGVNPQKYLYDESKKTGKTQKQLFVDFVQQAQKYDPGSKYLGFSGVPGVKSRKDINAEQEAANRAEAEAEQNASISDLFSTSANNADLIADSRKRSRRFAYGAFGRSDTIKTGPQGLLGGASGSGKTLLGY